MISSAANALILASTITASIDNIGFISIETSGGEVFRKAYLAKDTISSTERKYTFYLTEAEANVSMIKLALEGNGATLTLNSGTEIATQVVNIVKTATQSLLIYWNVKVI